MSAATGEGSRPFPLRRAVPLTFAVVLLVLAGLWAGGWRVRAFVSGQTDLGSYFIPKYQYAADRIAQGDLPQWNPFEFCGIPFLATIQPGVFYPPVRAVYAVLTGEDAYVAVFLLHVAIASVGALCLARDLRLGLWPAVFAAAWATQPIWLVRIYDHPVFLTGTVWMPLLLLLTRRIVRAPTPRHTALLALVAATQAVSGYPPMVLATAYVLLLSLPFWWLEGRGSEGRAKLVHVLAALAGAASLAFALAAVQLLPTVALAMITDRAAQAGTTRDLLATLARDTGDRVLLTMGIPPSTFATSLAALWSRSGPFLLVPAALAPLLRPSRPAVWYAVAAVGFTGALPFWAYAQLPFYGYVRFAFEWLFLSTFFVYLLAAIGIDALSSRFTAARPAGAVVTLVLLALASAWSWRQVDARWLAQNLGTPPTIPDVSQACDLHDPRYRSFWTIGHVGGSMMHEFVRSPGGYEQSLLPTRVATLQRKLGLGNGMIEPAWARTLAENVGAASRASLRCILTPPAPILSAVGILPVGRAPVPGAQPYLNRQALPRFRLEHVVVPAASADEALALLAGDPSSGVILEGTPASANVHCADPAMDHVELTRDAPEELVIRASSICPSYLVVSDTHLPGWTATVDGRDAPIEIADYAFRAVYLTAGEHEVVLRYTAPGLRAGTSLSLAGLAIVAVCLLRRPRQIR